MSEPLRIETISAYVSVDKDGNEGVCAFHDIGGGTWMPMVCADHARALAMRPIAYDIARATGQKIVLRQFSAATDLEEISP